MGGTCGLTRLQAIGKADLDLRPGQRHGSLLSSEDMLDLGAKLGLRGIGTGGASGHRLSLRLLAMDLAGEPGRYEMRLVLRRSVNLIRPDPARSIGRIQQVCQLRAVMGGGVRSGPIRISPWRQSTPKWFFCRTLA